MQISPCRKTYTVTRPTQDAAPVVEGDLARLIAVGAAVAANDEAQLKRTVSELTGNGVAVTDIQAAVEVGRIVKNKPAGIMKEAADVLARTGLSGTPQPGGCPVTEMGQETDLRVRMLIAAGAAMGANCEPCLNKAVPELIEAGVATADIQEAVRIGQRVKDEAAASVERTVDSLLESARVMPTTSGAHSCGETAEKTPCCA